MYSCAKLYVIFVDNVILKKTFANVNICKAHPLAIFEEVDSTRIPSDCSIDLRRNSPVFIIDVPVSSGYNLAIHLHPPNYTTL